MRVSRSAILDALYQRLSNIEGLRSASRRLRVFTQIDPSEQPILMVEVLDHQAPTEPGRPTRWTFRFNVLVFAREDSPDGPMPVLLDLVDRVEAALQVQPGEQARSGTATTLGGLVMAARVAGSIRFGVDAQFTEQSGVEIPVEVITS